MPAHREGNGALKIWHLVNFRVVTQLRKPQIDIENSSAEESGLGISREAQLIT